MAHEEGGERIEFVGILGGEKPDGASSGTSLFHRGVTSQIVGKTIRH